MQLAHQGMVRMVGQTRVTNLDSHGVEPLGKYLCALAMFDHSQGQVRYSQIDIKSDLWVHGRAEYHQHTGMQIH